MYNLYLDGVNTESSAGDILLFVVHSFIFLGRITVREQRTRFREFYANPRGESPGSTRPVMVSHR